MTNEGRFRLMKSSGKDYRLGKTIVTATLAIIFIIILPVDGWLEEIPKEKTENIKKTVEVQSKKTNKKTIADNIFVACPAICKLPAMLGKSTPCTATYNISVQTKVDIIN